MAEDLSDLNDSKTEKSKDAFRTITEVAEHLGVKQHVLRFWETKFPQIKPLKRGGGRRYYRPEDVTLLADIRDLLYNQGFTIKGVQKLLREGGPRKASDTVLSFADAAAQRKAGTAEETPVSPPDSPASPAVLPPALRTEMEAVIGELVTLRDRLKSVQGG